MRLIGIIFFSIGFLFFTAGLAWFKFTYDSNEGEQWELYIGASVFSLIGFVFAAIGGGILLFQRRQRLKREMLMRTGRKIRATIATIAENLNIRVNHRHPYIVTCTAIVSGEQKRFKSSNIYGSVLLSKGDELDVYIDFRNYDNYWVEVPADASR